MKQTYYIFLRPILLMVICLSLTFGLSQPVQAETCTWEGDTSDDWFTPANWSYASVPTTGDDVVIPSGRDYQPIIAADKIVTVNSIIIDTGAALTMLSPSGLTVNSISINPGAVLTILSGSAVNAATWTIDGAVTANTGSSMININSSTVGGGVVNVSATGTITKLGTGNLFFYSFLNNAGTMLFTDHGSGDGGVGLKRGGTHTGRFQGEYFF